MMMESDDEMDDASLRDRLLECQQDGRAGIPLDELLRYIREAAEVLDSLHEQSMMYRDVKPDSILLRNGHARLADTEGLQPASKFGMIATPAYVAPEAIQGTSGTQSAKSDQYSLAISYAELRLGRLPFSAESLAEVLEWHRTGTPELGPIPTAEQKAILKALAKEPERRYPNCQSFAQALERASKG